MQIVDTSTEPQDTAAAIKQRLRADDQARWPKDREVAVLLDVDWHGSPPTASPADLAHTAQPVPELWWVSQGGGIHALYTACDDEPAPAVLAAAAGVWWLTHSDCTGIELLTHSRGIGSSESHDCLQTYDLDSLRGWLKAGSADDSAIEEWCADHGTRLGARLPHTMCPCDPRVNATGGAPVVVLDDGVYCHVCRRRRSWGELTGAYHASMIVQAVEALVDIGNARRLLARVLGDRIDPRAISDIYHACLCAWHGHDDPRIPRALIERPALWGEGTWLKPDTLAPVNYKDRPSCQQWAACTVVNDEGKLATNADRVAQHITPGLAPEGYPAHRAVRGMTMAWLHREPRDTVLRVPVPLAGTHPTSYLPPSIRMPEDESRQVVEEWCPGVTWEYLILLLTARAHAEDGYGPVPMIMATGPSGAAKSATVRLAAGLLGDDAFLVSYDGLAQRVDPAEAIGDGVLHRPGWLVLDEYAKSLTGGRQLAAFAPLLTTDRGVHFRRNYRGPTRAQISSAIVLTNTLWSPEVMRDEQIGRRAVRVHLTSRVPDWRATIGELASWRVGDGRRVRQRVNAANSIISDVIDRWYATHPPPWIDIARSLGYDLQEAYDSDDTSVDLVRELWLACAESPQWIDGGRWRGQDWHVIEDWASRLGQAWIAVADNDRKPESRIIDGSDLQRLLDLEHPTTLRRVQYGRRLGLRWERADIHHNAADWCSGLDLLKRESTIIDMVPAAQAQAEGRRVLYIDLETRSRVDLSVASGDVYAADPSTEIMCAVCLEYVGQWTRVWYWTPEGIHVDPDHCWPTDSQWERDGNVVVEQGLPNGIEQCTLVAHNAVGFDMHVWRAAGWPEPAEWLDSMPMARAAALPGGLDRIGKQLYGMGKSRDRAALNRLYKPQKNGQFFPYNDQTALPLVRYCVQDVLLLANMCESEELAENWPASEAEVWRAHCAINQRGFEIDTDLARQIVDASEALTKRAVEEAVDGTELEPKDITRRDHLLDWCRKHGADLPDLRQGTIRKWLEAEDLEDESPIDDVDHKVVEVLTARLDAVRITASKLGRALQQAELYEDRRLRWSFVYHAAHTGRWSARGFQPHNLPRPPRGLDPIGQQQAILAGEVKDTHAALGALIRTVVRAAPGKVLGIVDYSKIEVCGLAWAAGQDDLLHQLDMGYDPYRQLASQIWQIEPAEVDDKQRGFAKALILGCGYRMGPAAFARYCVGAGVDLAAVGMTAREAVDAYRRAYPMIAGDYVREWQTPQGTKVSIYRGGYWRKLEDDARAAFESPGTIYGCYGMAGDHLVDILPSGRELVYRDTQLEPVTPPWGGDPRDQLTYAHPSGGRRSLHGGILTENHVQALCRDILAEALVRLEDAGLCPILHVHDEPVCELDSADQLEEMARIMCVKPAWAEGMPIHVEGFTAPRYTKVAPDGWPTVAM